MRDMNGRGIAASRIVSARLVLAAAVATACAASAASAADVTRTATAGALNLAASWGDGVTGPIPGSEDVAVWDTGSAGGGGLGADTSWGGIRVAAGEASNVSISGANVLTLGASGIDMSAAVANLTIQPTPTTTTGINLGAAQTWSVNAGRLLSVANGSGAITGGAGATITKTGAGTTHFNSALSTFAGGVTITQGAVTFNTVSVTTAGATANGPLGTGTITLNGGTLSVSTTSGRDLSNNVAVTADSTIGLAATNRVRSAGTWDLGGATRTLTLTNVGTAIGTGEQFAFIAQGTAPGNKIFTLLNGNLRFVGGATATAGAPAQINFAQGSGGVNFGNNGLTIGQNVLAAEGSSQSGTGINSPRLTLENNGVLMMSSASAAKSFTAYSLAGSGTVASYTNDAAALASTLTLDGTAGTTTFTGEIRNTLGYAVYGVTGSPLAVAVSVVKNGGSTQIFTGVNSYTGNTVIAGGTLAATYSSTGASAATPILAGPGFTDLQGGRLVLDHSASTSPIATVRSLLAAGAPSNFATGQIRATTSAATPSRGIGYAELGGGQLAVQSTFYGDATLDGVVNVADLGALATNYGATDAVWAQGDFNYDAAVSVADLGLLATYYGSGTSLTAADAAAQFRLDLASVAASNPEFAAAMGIVPEPTTLAAAGLAALAFGRRRRR